MIKVDRTEVEKPVKPTVDETLAQIAKESANKDVLITELQASNEELKVRLDTSERVAADASDTQQQLLELLIEMEVI